MKISLFRSSCMALALLLTMPGLVLAQSRAIVFEEEKGQPMALQEATRAERPRGPLFVSIPTAYVFGLEKGNTYCSPSVRATNSSNVLLEELIIGIEFHTLGGQSVGRSITRIANLKIQQQDAHHFYQLEISHCRGLEGTVNILRCKYANGDDCTKDVQASDYGTIPLKMKKP